MTAMVVPFPLARRTAMIQRQADYALCLKPEKAEQHIQRQIQTLADLLRRRGVKADVILRELSSMEAAIRTAMWHLTFDTPGEA
jgi:hypothetical protein